MQIHWTDGGPIYLEEWQVTWTVLAGETERTFELTIPAVSEDAAFDAAHAMAAAISEATNDVWGPPDEVTVQRTEAP